MQESIAAMVLVYIYLLFLLRTSTRIISITPGQSIKDSNADTLISANGIFQLGFFSPGNSASQYLGIWYNTKKVSIRTVVWVANRETPISGTSGALNITSEGILVLGSNTDSIFWSSNTSRTPQNPVAELLDSRNLVVRDGDENILWQSFDYPSDTLLPRMKLGNDSITGKDTLRCFHVGLLCVQQLPEDRPNMASVVLMLGSDGSLPQPKQPGFYTERNPFQIESSSHSVNQITSTSIEAR